MSWHRIFSKSFSFVVHMDSMICWPLCISCDRQAGWTDSVSYSRTMAELIALLYNLTSKIHQHWLPLLGLRTAGMREAFPPYLELRSSHPVSFCQREGRRHFYVNFIFKSISFTIVAEW